MGKSTFAIRIYLTVEDSLDIEQSRRLGVNLECHAASEIRGNVEPALLGKQSFYICRTSACRSGIETSRRGGDSDFAFVGFVVLLPFSLGFTWLPTSD